MNRNRIENILSVIKLNYNLIYYRGARTEDFHKIYDVILSFFSYLYKIPHPLLSIIFLISQATFFKSGSHRRGRIFTSSVPSKSHHLSFRRSSVNSSLNLFFMNRAGFPPTSVYGSTSFATTEYAV